MNPANTKIVIKPAQAYYDAIAQSIPEDKLIKNDDGTVAFKFSDADPNVIAAIQIELLITIRDLGVMLMGATGKMAAGSTSGVILPGQNGLPPLR